MKELKFITLTMAMSLLLSISACDAKESVKGSSVSEQVLPDSAATLDKQSRQSLGVSLVAIAMLFQSGNGSYLLEDALSTNEKRGISELVEAGYATANPVQDAAGTMIHLSPTVKGIAILKALGETKY